MLAAPEASAAADPVAERFAEKVQPILETYCYGCHGMGTKKGNVVHDDCTAFTQNEMGPTVFVGSQALPTPPVISLVANGASFSGKTDLSPGSFFSIFATGLGNTDNLAAFPATTCQ